jgi:predicted ATPase
MSTIAFESIGQGGGQARLRGTRRSACSRARSGAREAALASAKGAGLRSFSSIPKGHLQIDAQWGWPCCRGLRSIAAEGPVMLALDDVQWCDTATVKLR